MTDGPDSPALSEAMRLLFARAGHELRNAQNAAAVNLEVVRSRSGAGITASESLKPFADNAAAGLEESARIGEALVSLCSAVAGAACASRATVTRASSGEVALEIEMTAADARSFVERVSALSARGVFSAEAGKRGVILRVPPDNERNRA